jgi:Cyanobacterial TRADD-N associated 2-Transmembrane domain
MNDDHSDVFSTIAVASAPNNSTVAQELILSASRKDLRDVKSFAMSAAENGQPEDVTSSAFKNQALKGVGSDFFDSLIKISFYDLNRHYSRIKDYSRIACCLAASAWVASIGLVGVGVALLICTREISAASIVIGSGILAGALAALFFQRYSQNAKREAEFSHKLLLAHNVTLALKTAEQLTPDSHEKNAKLSARKDIVKELLQDINKLLAAGPSDGSSRR